MKLASEEARKTAGPLGRPAVARNAEPKRGIEEVCIRLIGCANVAGYSRLMHDDETGDDLQRPCA